MKGLILGNAIEVNREDIALVPTPQPTETWFPIPHSLLIDRVDQALQNAGLKVVDQKHGLMNGNQEYFGIMEVERAGDVATQNEYIRTIGLRNAHNKRFRAQLGAGCEVFVCTNMSFFAEVQAVRKHTQNIARDLPILIAKALGKLMEMWVHQDTRFETYKQYELSNSQVNDLLIRSMELGVMGATYIPKVLKEYREPSYPEFAANGFTAWRLFNAFTTVLKGTSVTQLAPRTQQLHGLLDLAVGLGTPVQQEVLVTAS